MSTVPAIAPAGLRSERRAVRRRAGNPVASTALFLGSHAVLGVLIRAYPQLATAHAVVTFASGLVWVATTRRLQTVIISIAYIAGCEVLWRMSKAGVFWEFGKYACIAILLVGMTRLRAVKNRGLAIASFALLLPSILMTLSTLGVDDARGEISFYLSGPLALAVCVLFFSSVRVSRSDLVRALVAFVGPVVGIAAISFFASRAVTLDFVNASNFAASGGFGPNQVSAILGLGVLFCLLLSVDANLPWRARGPLLGLAGLLMVQSLLTFARGGAALAFGGFVAALLFLVGTRSRGRLTVVLIALFCVVLGKYVIEPRLDDFTGGALAARYSNTKVSGRDKFVASELEMFAENPVLGVGPGIGPYYRRERGLFEGASHTEYTRLLAEHGIFGLMSLACLVALSVRAIRATRLSSHRAFSAAMVTWVALFLLVYGTRLVAPAVAFGFAFLMRESESKAKNETVTA